MSLPPLGQSLRSRSPSPRVKTQAAPVFRPRLEALEDRLLPSGFGGEAEGPTEDASDLVPVLTYNVDPGSHLAPLLAAPSAPALPGAVSQVWGEVVASDIPGRALALARAIAHAGPEVIGLQGAALWAVNGRTGFDFLALLQHDLRARGEHFIVAAAAPSSLVQLPDAAGNQIGGIDRTALLVNTDLFAEGFRMGPRAAGVFAAHSDLHVGGPQGTVLPSLGSWACVTLINTEDGDHTTRFVTARLDAQDPTVAAGQVAELLAATGQTRLPAVFMGDFGPVGSMAYEEMLQSGRFFDTWLRRHAAEPGFTSADPSLLDPVRALQARTDFVFIRDGITNSHIALLGIGPGDRTASGLWPSDHLGVLDDAILV